MSALRESAGPQREESAPTPWPAGGDLLLPPAGAPLVRLAGEPEEDEGEQHIFRGID